MIKGNPIYIGCGEMASGLKGTITFIKQPRLIDSKKGL